MLETFSDIHLEDGVEDENDDKGPAIGASSVTELSVSGEEPYDLVDGTGDAAESELPALEVAAEVHVGE